MKQLSAYPCSNKTSIAHFQVKEKQNKKRLRTKMCLL